MLLAVGGRIRGWWEKGSWTDVLAPVVKRGVGANPSVQLVDRRIIAAEATDPFIMSSFMVQCNAFTKR